MTAWMPRLSKDSAQPLFRRLVAAIEADISSGALAPGARLPPQRDLAQALQVGLSSVSRAYEEALRRGLLTATVGRGTFVSTPGAAAPGGEGVVDLSINTAPIPPGAVAAEAAALGRRAQGPDRFGYMPACGLDADRQAAARWLARTAGLPKPAWGRLMLAPGAQGGMAIALAALCRPGDRVMCEHLTFSGLKTLAAVQGLRLHAVGMDDEGLEPEALDQACAETGARVLYTVPSLQNPTARIQGAERRAAIAAIARARDLWILEDDVYASYVQVLDPPPLAALAPERTFYVSSLSKIIAPGLRAGFLIAPNEATFDLCLKAMRALVHSPAGPTTAIATGLIESGRADELASRVRAEATARTSLALDLLGDALERPAAAASLHQWLPTPEPELVAARALAAGVRIAAPSAFAVGDASAPRGLRLCLGAAPDRQTLARALASIKAALSGASEDHDYAAL